MSYVYFSGSRTWLQHEKLAMLLYKSAVFASNLIPGNSENWGDPWELGPSSTKHFLVNKL